MCEPDGVQLTLLAEWLLARRIASRARHLHDLHAPVAGERRPCHEPILDELLADRRDVSGAHHHVARNVAEHYVVRLAIELGKHVETREREVKLITEPASKLVLDEGRGRQEAKPSRKLILVMVFVRIALLDPNPD